MGTISKPSPVENNRLSSQVNRVLAYRLAMVFARSGYSRICWVVGQLAV